MLLKTTEIIENYDDNGNPYGALSVLVDKGEQNMYAMNRISIYFGSSLSLDYALYDEEFALLEYDNNLWFMKDYEKLNDYHYFVLVCKKPTSLNKIIENINTILAIIEQHVTEVPFCESPLNLLKLYSTILLSI